MVLNCDVQLQLQYEDFEVSETTTLPQFQWHWLHFAAL
jgi:hypothetical protein